MGRQQLGNTAAMAGASGLAAGLAAPPAYARTQNGATQIQTKSGTQVGEKAKPQVSERIWPTMLSLMTRRHEVFTKRILSGRDTLFGSL